MTSSLLEIKNLSVSYDSVQALRDVSLQVRKGSVVCLIGANGAGKSTVLRAISGIKKPSSGQILFKGQSITHLRPEEIVRLGVVQSPEGRGVFPDCLVGENLDLGAYVRQDKAALKNLEKVYALFPRLKERVKQLAGTLSGGEQQMLAMGRALMARPELLLLDEPSLGLAPQVIELIFETVAKISREGTTILLVEQNAQLALEASHYAYVLETGSTILEGEASKVLNDPRVKEAYLGETA